MLESSVNTELRNVIDKLISFWGKNISNIDIKSITDKPFDMFTLSIILYGKHDVLIEYDRSTLGFYVKKDGEYILL